jgi:hypothetical protein
MFIAMIDIPVPTYTDMFAWLSTATQTLLAVNEVFAQWGRIELAAIVVIMVSTFGVKVALAHAPASMVTGAAAELLGVLALTATILLFWTQPCPGVGMTLPGVLQVQADKFSSAIANEKMEQLVTDLEERQHGVQTPNSLDLSNAFAYYVYRGIIIAFELVAFAVIMLSYVFFAVGQLVGPIFIPLAPTKHFSSYFTTWLRFMIKMAMMRVVAAAVLLVVSKLIYTAFSSIPVWIYVLQLEKVLIFAVVILGSSLYIVFKIPAMTSELIGGSDAVGGLGSWMSSTAGRAMGIATLLG